MRPKRYKCGQTCYFEEHVLDLPVLSAGLPGREGFSDVDGYLHKNGHFLFIESKSEGVGTPTGQDIALRDMSRLTKHSEAWVIWQTGVDFSGDMTLVRYRNGKPSKPRYKVTLNQLLLRIKHWRWKATI